MTKSFMIPGLLAILAATLFAQGIPGVVAAGVQAEAVQENFTFTEGPVGRADGSLLFSDPRVSKTYLLDLAGKVSMFRENTNGTNGLAFLKSGDLLGAEGDGKRISRRASDGKVTALAEGTATRPLMAPNDVIADAKGGVYFTDPGPRPIVPGRKTYVYYLPAGGKEPLVQDDQIARPNGLVLTGDGKTLIVDDTVGDTVFAFDIQSDGSLKNKRPFAKLHDLPAGQESGADGMAIDRQDRVYVCTVTGVQVFDRKGQYLGTIKAPKQPANAAFAGPGKKTLYLTAREGLYKVQMLAQGPNRLGK
jgi:gluconolactonase